MGGSIKFCRIAVVVIAVLFISGCGRDQPAGQGGAAADDHAHDHVHEGLHGGIVIELGTENYHAELTHDVDTHAIAVYILDGSAAANSPVAVESTIINAVADDKPHQFILPANPLPDDPAGKTSRFELVDEQLSHGLAGDWDPHTANARVNLTIDDTPYFGEIDLHALAGDHEHADDHDHAEGEHAHDHDHDHE